MSAEPTAATLAKPDRTRTLLIAVLSTAAVAVWLGWNMGWVWALAGVFGIFIHELGHAVVINRAGCGPSRIHFIPFLGGVATQPKPAPNEFTGVLISLAGPAVGILATVPFFAIYFATQDYRWIEGAFFIAFINLINLFPAPPLDGSKALGPVLAKVHPLFEKIVVIALGVVAALWLLDGGDYLLGGIMILAMTGVFRAKTLRPQSLALDGRQTAYAVGLYLATVLLCFVVMVIVSVTMNLANPAVLLQGAV